MAQAMLNRDEFKKHLTQTAKSKNVAVQTGDLNELCITLSHSKNVRVYYSKSYKDYVASFNMGSSKKFIVTKAKWKILRKYLNHIDTILSSN